MVGEEGVELGSVAVLDQESQKVAPFSSQWKRAVSESPKETFRFVLSPGMQEHTIREAADEILLADSSSLATLPPPLYSQAVEYIARAGIMPLIIPNIPVVINRFSEALSQDIPEEEYNQISHATWSLVNKVYVYSEFLKEKGETLDINPHELFRLYVALYNSNLDPQKLSTLRTVFKIDDNNKTSVSLQNRFDNDIISDLVSEDEDRFKHAASAIETIGNKFRGRLDKSESMLIRTLNSTDNPDILLRTMRLFTSLRRFEDVREELRVYVASHPDFKDKYRLIDQLVGIRKSEVTHIDVRDVYRAADNMHAYGPNDELLPTDMEVLTEHLTKGEQTLDIGCGTGRHMQALEELGWDNVSGVDFMSEHLTRLKKIIPDAHVVLGSWHKLPFMDGQFNQAYCLGRSSLNNTTVAQWRAFLGEMSRILDKDGKFIMDLPDMKYGEYQGSKQEMVGIVQAQNFRLFTPGLIHDGPDLDNTFDRFVPSLPLFKAMAGLAGFDVKRIKVKQYETKGGNQVDPNVNIYWELKKMNEKLPRAKRTMYHYMVNQPHLNENSQKI